MPQPRTSPAACLLSTHGDTSLYGDTTMCVQCTYSRLVHRSSRSRRLANLGVQLVKANKLELQQKGTKMRSRPSPRLRDLNGSMAQCRLGCVAYWLDDDRTSPQPPPAQFFCCGIAPRHHVTDALLPLTARELGGKLAIRLNLLVAACSSERHLGQKLLCCPL